ARVIYKDRPSWTYCIHFFCDKARYAKSRGKRQVRGTKGIRCCFSGHCHNAQPKENGYILTVAITTQSVVAVLLVPPISSFFHPNQHAHRWTYPAWRAVFRAPFHQSRNALCPHQL